MRTGNRKCSAADRRQFNSWYCQMVGDCRAQSPSTRQVSDTDRTPEQQNTRYDPLLLQASSQGPPVSAVVYVAAGRWAQHCSSGTIVTVQRVRRRLQIFRLTYLLHNQVLQRIMTDWKGNFFGLQDGSFNI